MGIYLGSEEVEVRVVSDGKYSTIPGFVNGATSRHV
jgi:hypothetical protein